jgi:hypothetical protein
MNNKNCIYCNRTIRKDKLELYHLKCDKKMKQEQYEMKIAEFKEFFKSKGIHVII